MKKFFLITLMIAIAAVIILSGCGSEPAAPSPAPSPAPAPTPPPAPAKIEIIYTDHSPGTAAGALLFDNEYIPKLKEMVGPEIASRIVYTSYHASSLYPYAEQVNAVQQGLADITIWSNAFEVERAPLTDIMDLPFMGWRSSGVSTQVWEAMEATIPELAAEWDDFVVVGRWNGLKRVIAAKSDAKLPADFKGLKVIASGVVGDVFKSAGAAALQQAPADWYTSLDRGLADALCTGISMFPMFKLTEVTDYVANFPTGDLGYVGSTWIMNKEKFASMPPTMQNAIIQLRTWVTQKMIENDAMETAKGVQACIDAGMTMTSFTPEEEQLWFNTALPVHQQWIKDGESKGVPRQKIYDAAKYWIGVYETGKTK